jgi:hypothetical protein
MLDVFDIGVDEDGDTITSCAVTVPADTKRYKRYMPRSGGKHARDALELLTGMFQRYRENKGDGDVLVQERHWREQFCDMMGDKPQSTKRGTWNRVVKDLLASGAVRREGVHIFLTE